MIADDEGDAPSGSPMKEKVRRVAENHWAEAIVLVLVLLDVVFVSIEAGIDHQVICVNPKVVPRPSSAVEFAQHIPVSFMATSSDRNSRGARLRSVATSFGGLSLATDMAHPGEEEEEMLTCDTRHGEEAEHIMHTCHFWSIVILLVFSVELSVKWWAVPGFMNSNLHRLDFFVVIVSLIIDVIVIPYVEEQALQKENEGDLHMRHQHAKEIDKEMGTILMVTALLMISRCWRLVRIVHGLYEQYEGVFTRAEEEGKLSSKEENDKLRAALTSLGYNPDNEIASR